MGALFSMDGRLRRRDWWLWTLGLGLINFIVTGVIAPMVLGDEGRAQIAPGSFVPVYPPTLILVMIGAAAVLLYPNLALAVKRAHDRDKSGQMVVILYLAAALCGWVSTATPAFLAETPVAGVAPILSLVALAVWLFLVITLGFLDGTHGPNRYGPSPKGAQPPSTPHADYS